MTDVFVYPVILKNDSENYIFVTIPDIDGGYIQGENEIEAIKMASDAIGILLAESTHYPTPTDPSKLSFNADEKVVYVSVDLTKFRQVNSKKVRRNITIPEYLNNRVKAEKINVSEVTTEALKIKLGFS